MDSDPDIEFIEKDSGMSSLGGSKDDTPERRTAPIEEVQPSTSTSAAAASAAPVEAAVASPAPVSAPAAAAPATAAKPTTNTTTTVATKDGENYDDEPDETFGERLLGLTEMFPDSVRKLTGNLVDFTNSSVKTLYTFTCNASWIFFTSSVILFAPVIFETERAQMEEMQKTQQKQVLLGPGSAMAATGPTMSPAMPSMR